MMPSPNLLEARAGTKPAPEGKDVLLPAFHLGVDEERVDGLEGVDLVGQVLDVVVGRAQPDVGERAAARRARGRGGEGDVGVQLRHLGAEGLRGGRVGPAAGVGLQHIGGVGELDPGQPVVGPGLAGEAGEGAHVELGRVERDGLARGVPPDATVRVVGEALEVSPVVVGEPGGEREEKPRVGRPLGDDVHAHHPGLRREPEELLPGPAVELPLRRVARNEALPHGGIGVTGAGPPGGAPQLVDVDRGGARQVAGHGGGKGPLPDELVDPLLVGERRRRCGEGAGERQESTSA